MKERKEAKKGSASAEREPFDEDRAVPIDDAIRHLNNTACCSSDTVKRRSEVVGHVPVQPLSDQGDEFPDEDAEQCGSGYLTGEMPMTTGEHQVRSKPIDESDRSPLLLGDAEEMIPGFLPESGVQVYESARNMRERERKHLKLR